MRDAAKSKINWRVTTTWQGQTRSRAQIEGFGIAGKRVPRRFSIDIDEPSELGGTNQFANPQEHLLAALNACMMVGYVAQCAVRGITLESPEIQTDGDIDLRGFLGVDPTVPAGCEKLSYIVRIEGSGTNDEFAQIHEAVMATSPNFYNVSWPVASLIDGSEWRGGRRPAAVSPLASTMSPRVKLRPASLLSLGLHSSR